MPLLHRVTTVSAKEVLENILSSDILKHLGYTEKGMFNRKLAIKIDCTSDGGAMTATKGFLLAGIKLVDYRYLLNIIHYCLFTS